MVRLHSKGMHTAGPFAKNWPAQGGAVSLQLERYFLICQNIIIYRQFKLYTMQMSLAYLFEPLKLSLVELHNYLPYVF